MKYIFRGIVIFEYDIKTKAINMPHDKCKSGNFNFCHFIPEDYKLIAKFFNLAYQHANGEDVKLKNIEVY